MDVAGSLAGLAVGAGLGFAAARYLVPPRQKSILARLRTLLDQLPIEAIIRSKGEGRIVFANERSARVGALARNHTSASIPDAAGSGFERILALDESEVERELSLPAWNGEPARMLECRQSPVNWPGEASAVACVLTDITRHRLREAMLQARLDSEREIFDSAGVLLMVLDLEGHILRQNEACTRLFGPLARHRSVTQQM